MFRQVEPSYSWLLQQNIKTCDFNLIKQQFIDLQEVTEFCEEVQPVSLKRGALAPASRMAARSLARSSKLIIYRTRYPVLRGFSFPTIQYYMK